MTLSVWLKPLDYISFPNERKEENYVFKQHNSTLQLIKLHLNQI